MSADIAGRSGPFDDLRTLLDDLPGPDEEARAATRARDLSLTKPPGSLGRLEGIAEWLAAWQGRTPPRVKNAMVAVFAGNHGVVAQGVAAYPQAVTAQMVANFQAGGAAINQLCESFGLGLQVFELALEVPTGDIAVEPALSPRDCVATLLYGLESVPTDIDLLCIGEMGIGNTTVASALAHGLFGGEARDWVGPGTGLDEAGVAHKAEVVAAAVARHGPEAAGDPFEILRRLGGREIAAMAGAILGGRLKRVPVIVDGFVATSAAAVLHALGPGMLDHCLFGHVSAEPAHGRLLETLGKAPLLDLEMRLGEGTGAALAAAMAKAAADIHGGMATFAEAGVTDREEE